MFFSEGPICKEIITNKPPVGKTESALCGNMPPPLENVFLTATEIKYAFRKGKRTLAEGE